MIDTTKQEQEEIDKLTEDEKIMELDQLITQGINAKVPFTFTYPNTDKKVGVLVRPLSTSEYQNAILTSKRTDSNFLLEFAKLGVYKLNGERFPRDLLEKLPAGVIANIVNEINRISGIEVDVDTDNVQQEIYDDLLGF